MTIDSAIEEFLKEIGTITISEDSAKRYFLEKGICYDSALSKLETIPEFHHVNGKVWIDK